MSFSNSFQVGQYSVFWAWSQLIDISFFRYTKRGKQLLSIWWKKITKMLSISFIKSKPCEHEHTINENYT